MTNITYTKVTENDPEVITLSKAVGRSVKEVCGFLNNQRYRAAYNRAKNAQMKVLRQLVKEGKIVL